MSSQLDVMGRFETFINEFTDEHGILRYREKIREMPQSGSRSLYISFNDLLHHDPRLAEEVLVYPEECLFDGTKVLIKILQQIDPKYIDKYYQFHLRIEDLTDKVHLRTLRTEHLGLLTRFEGIVIGVTDTKPLLIEGHFKCASCGESNQIVEFPEGIYSPPYQCENDTCQRKGSLVLQIEYSRFIDWQKITIQEKPEELPPGQLPQSIMIHILDDLVDTARPGDRVEVVGVLKARASRMLKRGQLATYGKFFNGVSIRKETAEYRDIEITEEDLVQIKELSESPYIIEKIRDSLAPSIYGHDLVKEAIATLLFGGTLKETPDGMKIRGESNILLIGDPGVGKSQLLKFVARLAPRALYTTGKGSTAAGLCVSGDSEIWLSNNLTPISEIVEKEFQKGEVEIFNDTMKFKDISNSKLQTYNSKNLKINLQTIERVWRIKSPRNMYSVTTRTGRTLKLTPNTSLLTSSQEFGLVWKAAKLLKKNDRVATAGKIQKTNLKESLSSFENVSDDLKGIMNLDSISSVEGIINNSLDESDVFWDEITNIQIVKAEDKYVYDLTIPNTHNFVVNGFITHNTAAVIRDQDTGEITLEAGALVLADQGIAMIDEFDKMRPDDRTAIHEAMEQHSYHPSFEIMFSDGRRTHIGSYIDDLFSKFGDRKQIGVECEILPILDHEESVYSTDFNRQFHHPVTHVSRHSAPDHFIQIKYSNGRTIMVTPEHPVFTFQDEYIDEISAEKLCTGDFIPAVRSINCTVDDNLSLDIELGRKKVKLPSKMTSSLARFLGYYISEGYSYEGSSIEVGLSNTDSIIISDMIKCIEDTFGIKPIDNTEKGRVLRIISKSVFEFLKKNFPEIMKLSIEKRIPRKIFSTSFDNKVTFLNAAFLGDGAIESEALAFSTSSKELAFDYQDLMLNIGIHSRIHSSSYLTKINREPRIRYKVYIRGDNLDTFVNLVIPKNKDNGKLGKLLSRTQKVRGHDVLPPSVGHIIKRCMKKLGIPYNGYFQQAFQENCGITIEVINRYLDQIFARKTELEQKIPAITDMETFRRITNLSQNHIAKLTGSSRGNIDYIERGGYVLAKRIQVLAQAKHEFAKELDEVEQSLIYIENLKKFWWLRISKIKTILNKGKFQTNWVYDVTVDPIRTFISQGIILHNTISIAKAGIVATLNARTSILAAANPKRGRWNPFKATAENLNLPPTILSRFDLIFVLEDKPNIKEDHDKATHILNLHKLNTLPVDPPIQQELLRKYIAYARSEIRPKLSDDAVARLLEYYTELRASSGRIEEGRPDPIAITPRQLEALVRLSEARAKMRLSEEVTYEDASGAVHLMNATLDKLARDETGKLDIDKYSSGLSDQGRRRLDRIDDLIDNMLKESDDGEPVAISAILAQAVEDGLDRNQVEKAIEQRIRVGKLFSPQPGRVKKI